MLKIPDGILNVLLGKLVPVTNYGRAAENIFAPAKANKSRNTSFQRTTQREKIKVCNEFTRAFSGKNFFNKTFPCYNKPGTGINKAINIIMDVGITGSYPHSRISYPQVLVSKGLLPGAENAAAADNEEHNILFSWTDNTGNGTAKATDKVILVAYFPAAKKAIYSVDAALRKDCRAYLETTAMEGYNAETWIGFISEDEEDAANSRYTGTIYL
jgi:hypothetical protein